MIKEKKVHFLGISGIGMSALARLAHFKGYQVSGSDLKLGPIIEELEEEGIKVYQGHSKENIEKENPDYLVISSAIDGENPELLLAREKGLKIWKRAEFLNYLTQDKRQLAVSGTHGKTTTSSFLGEALLEKGYQPLIFVGGISQRFKSNLYLGKGDYFVLEADESDSSFHFFSPYASIITNIEEDHLDFYKNLSEVKKAFFQFALRTKKLLVLNGDDPNCLELKEKLLKKMPNFQIITYGLVNSKVDYLGTNITFKGRNGIEFDLLIPGNKLEKLKFPHLGSHNLSNAISVLALLRELKLIGLEEIQKVLLAFRGVKRRFEILGKFQNAVLVDDYAHHPTEIDKVLSMAEEHYGRDYALSKVRIIFQPHRFSRLENFYFQFASIFNSHFFHQLLLAPVYSAFEEKKEGIDTSLIYQHLNREKREKSLLFSSLEEIENYLRELRHQDEELWLFLGAGDINKIPYNLLEK